MASDVGYVLIKGAISPIRAKEAADAIDKEYLKVTSQHPKWKEFEVNPVGLTIRDDFMLNSDKTALAEFYKPNLMPSKPISTNIGIFQKTDPDPESYRGTKPLVYVTIALTDLNPENGWFIFLGSSHRTTNREAWQKVPLKLSAGDAVVWYDRLGRLYGSGGGGKFATLVFEL